MDFIDRIIALETGDLDERGIVDLVVEMANDGLLFRLQGSYQQCLKSLIDQGYIRQADGKFCSTLDEGV
jgi:hypothetical protein